ncbi:metabolite traffic protein EboE [Oculatella sp. LEGE 06141]|uniref:metabolite traffic protein EboE n=1 Tax=Oculatella sp. LEGE 06141 TaxID=1828648 RepID=UPI00187E02B9|nr:metabolite traffic protein EboE [Oculatella sp. LEGE 06141]MBE9179971.1 metabolite traffic protein EboE [Oculatella sp. LEGE 06141]
MHITTASPHPSHLTYCTNIHPGESWPQVFNNVQHYIPPLKASLSPTAPFGIGLRLANIAAQALHGDTLAHFQTWLTEQDLYVFTLNGFPFGSFHGQVVKDRVYAPDWSQRSRLDYTKRLAHILAALLPSNVDGSISTLPLSYKPWWIDQSARATILRDSSHQLALLAAELIRLRQTTGKQIHLDLEPEPDGLIETTIEAIDFFNHWLLPIGKTHLNAQLGLTPAAAEAHLREHIRICYDTCHFAVEYENPLTAFTQLQAAGIQVGKVQISAALKVALPHSLAERHLLRERLQPFAESTYLHQVIARHADGTLHHYPDLAIALPHLEHTTAVEWRTHFHVPIFVHDYDGLHSTQDDIATVLRLLATSPASQHFEIETYTWDVLPPALKTDILPSIQREYEWVLETITSGSCKKQLSSMS